MATPPSLFISMNSYIMRSLEPENENGGKLRELARLARNFDEYMKSPGDIDSFISTLGGIISDYKGDHGCTENDIIDSAEHRVAIIDAIYESLGPGTTGRGFLNDKGKEEVDQQLYLGSTSSDSSSSEVGRSQVQSGSGGGRASSGYKNTRSKKRKRRNSQKRVSKKNNRTKRRKKTRRTRRTRRRTIKGGGKGEDIQSLLDDWGYLSDTQKSDRQATLKREHGILALTQFHMKKMIN
jgi:hypothetical protein